MGSFTYKARDGQGVVRKGTVEAASPVAASDILHNHGLTVLELTGSDTEYQLERYLPFLNRVSKKEIVLFSRQLATLINAKVPIIQALEILLGQLTNKPMKDAITEMSDDIEGGKSFSEAISKHPNIFSNLYVNLVKAGEISGTLDQSLVYLANQQERDYDLTSKIRGAMIYPIFIVSAIAAVGALMFTFVLPQMISVLEEAGADLPLTTRMLIIATKIFQGYWALLIFGLLGTIIGLRLYIHTPGGRIVWDTLKIKAPIFGKLFKDIYMNRFARNLSTLVAGGIPIVQALTTIAEIVGNKIYREIILEAAADVETGKSIANVFENRKEIPTIVTQMIRVGEQTGSLDEILQKLATFYEKEVDTSLSTLTTLLEPIIMLILGIAVAVMVAGILLPIYNLANVQ